METHYYFGYGSNLHPGYMEHRLAGSKFVGSGVLGNYRLEFNKVGKDKSGKANIMKCGNARVYGSLYSISATNLDKLDKQELGYQRIYVDIQCNSKIVRATTYKALDSFTGQVKPFGWYLELVLFGARGTGIDSGYIKQLENVITQIDTNRERRKKYTEIMACLGE